MHIILGILGAIVVILVLLKRLAEAGIDLGGLNPFGGSGGRRQDWQLVDQGEPVYQLADPMEVTALLMAAIASTEGDISAEQKRGILVLFENDFHLATNDAVALLNASTGLMQDGKAVTENVFKILAPSLDAFSAGQANSCLALIEQVAGIDGPVSAAQREFIDEVRTTLHPRLAPASDRD